MLKVMYRKPPLLHFTVAAGCGGKSALSILNVTRVASVISLAESALKFLQQLQKKTRCAKQDDARYAFSAISFNTRALVDTRVCRLGGVLHLYPSIANS